MSLQEGCAQLGYQDCAEFAPFELEHIELQKYVQRATAPASVRAAVFQFASPEAALARFSILTLGAQDPVSLTARPVAIGTFGAMGDGVLRAVKGTRLLELSYANDLEALGSRSRNAEHALLTLAGEISARMPSDGALPNAVKLLPIAQRVPLGVSYFMRDALDVQGAGPAALGYYQDGQKRWRVLCIERNDADSAKDIALTLQKAPGFRRHKDSAFGAFELIVPIGGSSLAVQWVIARQEQRLWAVGDEVHVLDARLTDQEIAARRLTFADKLDVLHKLLQIRRGP
ncbi:MAG TPA: DUF6599 family protein [Polyangiaceae bacterium]|nr:DUF6599 family protein [Polyangiaceae bacterium]